MVSPRIHERRWGRTQRPVSAGNDLDYPTVNPLDPTNAAGGQMVRSQFSAGWVWHYEDDISRFGGSPPTSPSGQPLQNVFIRHKINGGGATVSEDIFTLQMNALNAPDLARPSSAHVDV